MSRCGGAWALGKPGRLHVWQGWQSWAEWVRAQAEGRRQALARLQGSHQIGRGESGLPLLGPVRWLPDRPGEQGMGHDCSVARCLSGRARPACPRRAGGCIWDQPCPLLWGLMGRSLPRQAQEGGCP